MGNPLNNLPDVTEGSEALIVETEDIGGQAFSPNPKNISKKASDDTNRLISTLETGEKLQNMSEEEKNLFVNNLTEFKQNQLELKAGKKILEKKYEKFDRENKIDLDGEKEKTGKKEQAEKKTYARNMNLIAAFGLGAIIFLMVQSVACVGCNSVTAETNPYTQILESNVMIVIVSTIIAPVAARILKDKLDIEVEAKQIAMVMTDGIKSVTMYAKEADKLRDENGHIPRKYQKVLRNKAFKVIKQNYGPQKYKDLIANVGSQVFEKAIEAGVAKGKLERFPFEKEQVEAVIKQSIDALPIIVKWKDIDEEVKHSFIDGNIRKLLQNAGAEGWAYKKLETIFDAEVSKRLVSAAIADKEGLLEKLDPNDPLRYASTTADAVFSTLVKH